MQNRPVKNPSRMTRSEESWRPSFLEKFWTPILFKRFHFIYTYCIVDFIHTSSVERSEKLCKVGRVR